VVNFLNYHFQCTGDNYPSVIYVLIYARDVASSTLLS
jgi:hypothetical protein